MVSVYLNGRFVGDDQAMVSIDDRGFLFADGVYEVVHIYEGYAFAWDRHMARLTRSLAAVNIVGVESGELAPIRDRLIADHPAPESALYVQITRGVQRRNHAPPEPGTVPPTVLMWVRPISGVDPGLVSHGASLITVPDDRWGKVWIKTVGLLPNVLARGQAVAAGAYDAVFVRDGMVTEATAANIFRISRTRVQTAPVTNYILPGITRAVILEIARDAGYQILEEPFTLDELYGSDELFLTGTNTEVLPVTTVDGRRIGSGAPGPIAMDLLDRFRLTVLSAVKGG